MSALRRAAMWAQRRPWRPPAAVQAILRPVARRVLGVPAAAVDDWSGPLLAGGAVPAGMPPAGVAQDGVAQDGVAQDGPRRPAPPPPRPARAPSARCLLVTGGLDASGLDEVVSFLATGLPAQGLHTAVLHCVPDGHRAAPGRIAAALRAGGVDVVTAGPADGARFLRDWAPDVVSAHAPPDWALDAAAAGDVPVVETLHGLHHLMGGNLAWEAARAGGVSVLVAVSERVRRQYLGVNPGFPAARVVTVPNAVNPARLVGPPREAARAALGLRGELLFLSLGRYDLQKNSFGLVAAFAEVAAARPDVHLLVAGRVDDPAYAAQVTRLRDRCPAGARIHLREHFARPAELLAAADAFVLDSFFEGWALASTEALCFGLPVVVSDVGGAREQVGTGGGRGYVVANPLGHDGLADWQALRRATFAPQPNREELVAAMLEVADRRAAWAEARPALRAESRDRFGAAPCLAGHARVLLAAAAAQPPPPGGRAAG